METVKSTSGVRWFAHPPPSASAAAPGVKLIRILAGQPLFKEGDQWSDMYIVKEGTIGLFIKGKNIETVTAAGILGEMSLIDKAPRSATAIALTDAVLLAIDEAQFYSMIRQTPSFAVMVMRVMCKRLRQMDAARC